jgi:hypothetical protein
MGLWQAITPHPGHFYDPVSPSPPRDVWPQNAKSKTLHVDVDPNHHRIRVLLGAEVAMDADAQAAKTAHCSHTRSPPSRQPDDALTDPSASHPVIYRVILGIVPQFGTVYT